MGSVLPSGTACVALRTGPARDLSYQTRRRSLPTKNPSVQSDDVRSGRPVLVAAVAETAPEVGKKWVATSATEHRWHAGVLVAASKSAQSHESDDGSTGAAMLAAAAGNELR